MYSASDLQCINAELAEPWMVHSTAPCGRFVLQLRPCITFFMEGDGTCDLRIPAIKQMMSRLNVRRYAATESEGERELEG